MTKSACVNAGRTRSLSYSPDTLALGSFNGYSETQECSMDIKTDSKKTGGKYWWHASNDQQFADVVLIFVKIVEKKGPNPNKSLNT